jgi:hypothetical protein
VAENQTVVHVTKSGSPMWMLAGLAALAALGGGGAGWLLRRRRMV